MIPKIPNNDPLKTWIVVRRHCRDTTNRGVIIETRLSRLEAKYIANRLNKKDDWIQYWAMEKSDY